jgi:hypothetical protein
MVLAVTASWAKNVKSIQKNFLILIAPVFKPIAMKTIIKISTK